MAAKAMPIFMPIAQAASVSKNADVYTSITPSMVKVVSDSGMGADLEKLRRRRRVAVGADTEIGRYTLIHNHALSLNRRAEKLSHWALADVAENAIMEKHSQAAWDLTD